MVGLSRIVVASLFFALYPIALLAADTELDATVLVDGFVKSFNAHNAQSFGQLFTEDADWVSVAGIRVKGRDNIQAEHHEAFATFFSAATLTAIEHSARLLSPEVAVVHFNWRLEGQPDQAGKSLPPRKGIITIVAVKSEGTWKIAAGQNTNLYEPA